MLRFQPGAPCPSPPSPPTPKPLTLLKMDLRKISSLVFSAGQRKLPEIVSLVSFNFGLYVQSVWWEWEEGQCLFFPNASNNVAQLEAKPLFYEITVTQGRGGPAKRNKTRPVGLWKSRVSQSENKSHARTLYHYSSFDAWDSLVGKHSIWPNRSSSYHI